MEIFLIIVVYFVIMFFVARMMETSAALKGYGTDAHAFIMTLLLGIIGCIYVASLPDKIQQKQNEKIIELLSNKKEEKENEKM